MKKGFKFYAAATFFVFCIFAAGFFYYQLMIFCYWDPCTLSSTKMNLPIEA